LLELNFNVAARKILLRTKIVVIMALNGERPAQFRVPQCLSPPPSSFGGFGATFQVALFLLSKDRKMSLTLRYFFNKITTFRRIPDVRTTQNPMPTLSAKPHEVKRDWYLVDASGKVLGRLAAEIARRLRGKHKPEFTPHVDTGDFIVVVNAGKVRVTGNKARAKTYYRHSTYPGGVYATTFGKMQARFPTRALEIAVKGMLPKGPLGYAMFKKLKVYANGEHPHAAQQPKALEVKA
jgi:large subunit ribosomal protein L13